MTYEELYNSGAIPGFDPETLWPFIEEALR